MQAQLSPPTSRITLRHERHPEQTPREVHDLIREDRYELRIALCRGKVDLTCDGRRLYAGLVLPGMMRLMSPGEQVRQVVYTASEAIALDIPGPHLRAAGGPAPAAPARRALLDQPPCCGASSRSNGLAAWPWTPNAWTRCTPNSSWTA
jgi:hypothetical protein